MNTNKFFYLMKSKANIILGLLVLLIGTTVSAQSLKVMTYNIRLDIASDGLNDWSHRKEFLIAQLQFYTPDVFGVQEATPNQVTDLTQAFAKYIKVGIGRELEGKGEASCVYFRKDRFDLLQSNTFWLSETPNQVSMGWDAACNRVCTYVLLKDKKSKQFLWVFNTHLDHMGQEARTKGIQLISKTIAELIRLPTRVEFWN
jgi:endonuclease/exonuclease/phosphatase family metal-dependent hydrolase